LKTQHKNIIFKVYEMLNYHVILFVPQDFWMLTYIKTTGHLKSVISVSINELWRQRWI